MKVAILIPTMNRPDFIERTVAYYNSLNSPHPIYIGDASDPDASALAVNNLKKFKNVEVKYFNWRGVDISRTIVRLAEKVQRDHQYCAYHGDDDFFVPLSLTKCARILAENRDYRTAQGRAALVEMDAPGAYGNVKAVGPYWGRNSLEQDTSLGRVESLNEKYFNMQFAVHRTNEFLDDSKSFKEVRDYSLGEFLHSMLFAIRGRSKFVDCLFLIRHVHDERTYNPLSFADWVMRPHWSSDLEKCVGFLSLALHESSNMPMDQSRQNIIRLFAEYFEKCSSGNFQVNGNMSFMSRIKRLLPIELKNTLRPLNTLIMDESDMRLLRSKRSRFFEEFLSVCNSFVKE